VGQNLWQLVARMERSVIRDRLTPDYAALHPGYGPEPLLLCPCYESVGQVLVSGSLSCVASDALSFHHAFMSEPELIYSCDQGKTSVRSNSQSRPEGPLKEREERLWSFLGLTARSLRDMPSASTAFATITFLRAHRGG
jgi:hypothetical protein